MCNQENCNHDDGLDDDIGDIFGTEPLTPEHREAGERTAQGAQYKMHEEKCKKCRGRGRFISYSGRDCGPCFTCKGKGVLFFRQSLEQREKAREQKAKRDANNREAWAADHADVVAWCFRKAEKFGFALAMRDAINQYGHLTDRQLETCERLMAADAEREAQWAAEREAKAASAPEIDITAISAALSTARSAIMYPKLRLAVFVFSLAPATGKNAGSIYVKGLGEDGTYYGKITAGRFHASRDCTEMMTAEIIAAAASPEEAARAYGLEFGICSCCGRRLTNKLSIELGIGPICRERFGWG